MKARSVVPLALLVMAGASQAAIINWVSNLSPEVPGANGTGSTIVTFDSNGNLLRVRAEFSGLSGLTTQAHIHCCTATPFTGAAGIAVDSPSLDIDLNVGAGDLDQTLDMDLASSWGTAYLNSFGGNTDNALAALLAGLNSGRAYLNIHSTTFRGGEIRGFLVVPEPASYALVGAGLLAAGAFRRKSRASATV